MMKLSIIIPVFNEEKTISAILKKVLEVNIQGVEKEIIVVDDGSSDRTVANIKYQISNIKNIKFIIHPKNLGKGAAVRTGIKLATGDYILIQDADLEYNPQDIPLLLKPILQKNAIVVFGTRLKRLPNFRKDEKTLQFLLHYMGNKFLSLLTSILYGQWITDMETCYKIFPRQIVQNLHLRAKRFDLEPEITAKILKRGIKIVEISISTTPRGYKEGKKLRTLRDGSIAFWTLLKYRFVD